MKKSNVSVRVSNSQTPVSPKKPASTPAKGVNVTMSSSQNTRSGNMKGAKRKAMC